MAALKFIILLAIVPACFGKCTQRAWFDSVRSNTIGTLAHCLSQGFPVDEQDELGCPAIVNAAANQHVETVAFLISAGADVTQTCFSGSSALTYAAKLNNLDLTKVLFAADKSGKTVSGALTAAVVAGNLDTIRFLHGMTVDLLESWSGNELLWAAANNQDVELRHMVARGLSLESVDAHGHTAVILAALKGATVSLRILIDLGANIEARSHGGMTAVIHAAYFGQTDALVVLQEAGADFHARDSIGWGVVHWAAAQGHNNALLFLISLHMDLSTPVSGWSPLQVATAANQESTVNLLLRHGADWKARNAQGLTCEDIARNKGYSNLAALFRRMRETVEYEINRAATHVHMDL